MALGRQRERQADMLVSWAEMPRSPGHVFYDKLQAVLIAADFDGFVETQCATEYAPRRGRPSLPPGRYFRMLLIGYFEGIDSERGLEWRCADSLSLREFLRLGERERVPDHSWLSRTRSRLPLEVHDQVFTWVLERLAEHGLIKGERIGVDASTMEANAALRTIVRRDSKSILMMSDMIVFLFRKLAAEPRAPCADAAMLQTCARPPSTKSSAPVTKLAPSEARKTAALGDLVGSPTRPSGTCAAM